jgi:hypothetical protein
MGEAWGQGQAKSCLSNAFSNNAVQAAVQNGLLCGGTRVHHGGGIRIPVPMFSW